MLSNKPAWMSEAAWRATRTFVQVFVGVFVAALIVALNAYASGGELDLNFIWLQGVVLGVATALGAIMNRTTDREE